MASKARPDPVLTQGADSPVRWLRQKRGAADPFPFSRSGRSLLSAGCVRSRGVESRGRVEGGGEDGHRVVGLAVERPGRELQDGEPLHLELVGAHRVGGDLVGRTVEGVAEGLDHVRSTFIGQILIGEYFDPRDLIYYLIGVAGGVAGFEAIYRMVRGGNAEKTRLVRACQMSMDFDPVGTSPRQSLSKQ